LTQAFFPFNEVDAERRGDVPKSLAGLLCEQGRDGGVPNSVIGSVDLATKGPATTLSVAVTNGP
jgi:hypothetical protein